MSLNINKIENVGIKNSQKNEIEDIVRLTNKYKSINEFVQTSVNNLLNQDKQDSEPKKEDFRIILKKISKYFETLLEEEFSEKIILTSQLIEVIERIQYEIVRFNRKHFSSRTSQLLASRSLKSYFDSFIGILESDNLKDKLKITNKHLEKLKSLREEFINSIISKG